jgi:hypothetical protein
VKSCSKIASRKIDFLWKRSARRAGEIFAHFSTVMSTAPMAAIGGSAAATAIHVGLNFTQ